MQRRFASVLITGLVMALGACEDPAPETTVVPIRVDSTIAAVVNGETIRASEVELEAAAQGKIDPGQELDVDDPVFDEILQQLIDQKLLAQEAIRRDLNSDENAIHRLQAARERILGNILVENLVAEEVDEAAILEMYEAQTALQQLGEEVLVRHIVVDSQDVANELYDELRGGAEFAELAFAHSIDCSTNAEGGLLGYVLPEEFAEPLPSVINRTAVGAISQPFRTELGWHIIKVEDRRTERPPTFDETRPKIVQFLTLNEISKVLTRLRTRADIQTITGDEPLEVVVPEDTAEVLDLELSEENDSEMGQDSIAGDAEAIEDDGSTIITPETAGDREPMIETLENGAPTDEGEEQ